MFIMCEQTVKKKCPEHIIPKSANEPEPTAFFREAKLQPAAALSKRVVAKAESV
jgi:hypothetical protein